MSDTPSSPRAGGAAIALCTILGVVVGAFNGQPSIGFLGGAGVGILIAVAVWLRDRNRS